MAVFEFLFLKLNRESVFNDLVQLRGAFLETASENINSRQYTTFDFVYRGFSPQHIFLLHESGLVSSDCVSILTETLTALQQCEACLKTSHSQEPLGMSNIIISRGQLEFLLSMGFINKTQLSRMLGVSTHTIGLFDLISVPPCRGYMFLLVIPRRNSKLKKLYP